MGGVPVQGMSQINLDAAPAKPVFTDVDMGLKSPTKPMTTKWLQEGGRPTKLRKMGEAPRNPTIKHLYGAINKVQPGETHPKPQTHHIRHFLRDDERGGITGVYEIWRGNARLNLPKLAYRKDSKTGKRYLDTSFDAWETSKGQKTTKRKNGRVHKRVPMDLDPMEVITFVWRECGQIPEESEYEK